GTREEQRCDDTRVEGHVRGVTADSLSGIPMTPLCDVLFELQGALRKTEEITVDDGPARVRFVEARAERDEQWHEVIDGGMGVRQTGRATAVVEERVDVALREHLRRPVVELLRPRRGGCVGTKVT